MRPEISLSRNICLNLLICKLVNKLSTSSIVKLRNGLHSDSALELDVAVASDEDDGAFAGMVAVGLGATGDETAGVVDEVVFRGGRGVMGDELPEREFEPCDIEDRRAVILRCDADVGPDDVDAVETRTGEGLTVVVVLDSFADIGICVGAKVRASITGEICGTETG